MTEPYSVTSLTKTIKQVLTGSPELQDVLVEGEVSNLRIPASGHMFFTLKDATSQLRCVCFRFQRMKLGLEVKNGITVLAHGRIDCYPADGSYQLYVDRVEQSGLGALALEIRKRTEQLRAEGLFDAALKRPLPLVPRRVAVITSATGAAVRDMCRVISRRAPMVGIVVIPAVVQGEGAAASLVAGVLRAQDIPGVDVILLSRGGGSFEDLVAFQDETLARTIRSSRIPVVTGIGHEIDISIADFAADRTASTPSAAAEIVAPVRENLLEDLSGRYFTLGRTVRNVVLTRRSILGASRLRFERSSPKHLINIYVQDVEHRRRLLEGQGRSFIRTEQRSLEQFRERLRSMNPLVRIAHLHTDLNGRALRLRSHIERICTHERTRLDRETAVMESLSPLRTLERGYSITLDATSGVPVLAAGSLHEGQHIETRLHQGRITSTVTAVSDEDAYK